MNHNEIKEKILFFNDPELGQAEKQVLQSHLETCAECGGILKDWESARASLSVLKFPAASNSFVSNVMARIEELEEPLPETAANRGISWQLPQWIFPSLGYGLAIVFMFILVNKPVLAANTSIDTALLSDVPATTQWAFSNENINPETMYSDEEELL